MIQANTEAQVEETGLVPAFVEMNHAVIDGWLILFVTNLWSSQESQIDEGYGKLKAGTSSKMAQMGYVYNVAMLWVGEGEEGPLPPDTITFEQYQTVFEMLTDLHARMQVRYQNTLRSESVVSMQQPSALNEADFS